MGDLVHRRTQHLVIQIIRRDVAEFCVCADAKVHPPVDRLAAHIIITRHSIRQNIAAALRRNNIKKQVVVRDLVVGISLLQSGVVVRNRHRVVLEAEAAVCIWVQRAVVAVVLFNLERVGVEVFNPF